MFWKARTYKIRDAGWKTGLMGLAILGLILSGGLALDSALGVALDGGDGTVILVTSNHLSNDPSDDELVPAKTQSQIFGRSWLFPVYQPHNPGDSLGQGFQGQPEPCK